jgi:hypothetical protein
LRRKLRKVLDAVLRLDAGEPGEWNTTGVQAAPGVRCANLRDGSMIDPKQDVDFAGLGLRVVVSYAV